MGMFVNSLHLPYTVFTVGTKHISFKDGACFCYCAYVLRISGYSGFLRNLPLIRQYFCAVYDYVEKADFSKGYQNPKRNLGVTTHFQR